MNSITSGNILKKFTLSFSKFIEKEFIHTFSSGSQALYELLLSLRFEDGSDILIPSYICNNVKKAINKAKLNAIYYDNQKDSWISSADEIRNKITKKTKVIVVNHTFGIRYNKSEIESLQRLNIPLIEDNAHFISNNIQDIEISNLFLASIYSFNATKLLTTGEGGAVATNDNQLNKRLCKNILDSGFSDINAAIGLSQLNRFHEFLVKRKEIACFYIENLGDVAKAIQIEKSIFFRFPILVANDKLFLKSKKVAYKKGVDNILSDLENVKDIFKKTISLPIYPLLTKEEMDMVVKETIQIIERKS